eukprot:m.118431 g.118431  ORF g.118431 m.118431 type:complete len:677 (+) comp14512_c0_seq2:95-2125(+)
MGRGEKELLNAAAENDYGHMIDLLSQKVKPTIKDTLKASILGKKRSQDPAPKWPTNPDGSFLRGSVSHIKVEYRDEASGSTPLILAALGGHREAVECLIVYGANVDARDSSGNTALHMAAWQEKHHSAEIIEVLLKNGANANERNTKDSTPLHHACHTGQAFAVMLLLDHGAQPDLPNLDGDLPLDIAAREGHGDVVSLLLSHAPALVSHTRALREAARTGRKDVVRLLLDRGMDCTAADAESGDTALHEACRFVRLDVAEHLLAFGADAHAPNTAGETAVSLAENYPAGARRDRLLALVKEYAEKEVLVPAIVLDQRQQRKAQEATLLEEVANDFKTGKRSYPQLRCRGRWVEDKPAFRSASDPDSPVTNLFADDPSLSWCAPLPGAHWAIFDLGNPYTVTAFTVTGWCSKTMPKDMHLEVSDAMAGPWRVVKAVSLACECPPDQLDPVSKTFRQHFAGFYATSRYWRINILRNHGATKTVFQGIALFGLDTLLLRWFNENGLGKHYEMFVNAGFNQVQDLKFINADELSALLPLLGQRKKMELAIKQLRGEMVNFDRLVFSVPPPPSCSITRALPLFEVQANPGVDQEVELVAVGGATIRGHAVRRLTPNGPLPSSAIFDDIMISPPGTYVLEVRSVLGRSVFVRAARPIVIEPEGLHTAIELLFSDFEPLLAF